MDDDIQQNKYMRVTYFQQKYIQWCIIYDKSKK